jgi:hypothetical protein
MNDSQSFMERLRRIIGRECRFYGRSCRVVEILIDEGLLVLESREPTPPIQADQYGQAAYRANDHIEVTLFDQAGDLSEDLMQLLDGLSAEASSKTGRETDTRTGEIQQ